MLELVFAEIGSGKTLRMVARAKEAYEGGQPVFTNIDIDPSGWDGSKGGVIHRWHEPIDLIRLVGTAQNPAPWVRCGLVVFDELGAVVNNRESDYWPFELTVKLIEHRKDHLDFVATAQSDDMADKNMRRFYNRVNKATMYRVKYLGALAHLPLLRRTRLAKRVRAARRSEHLCPWRDCTPTCNKDGGVIFAADPWHGFTLYRYKDIDPKRTQNIAKHNSRGSQWWLFDPLVADAYGTTQKVSAEAVEWNRKAREAYLERKGKERKGGRRSGHPQGGFRGGDGG